VSRRTGESIARWLTRVPPVNAHRRRIAATNIDLCCPHLEPAAREALLAKTLLSNTTGVLETLRGWFATPAQLAGLAKIDGIEHLHAATA